MNHGPGSLVRARGRDWIVLPGGDTETLRVRPLAGSEDEQTLIHLGLELEPVVDASFPPPNQTPVGNQESARLLQDALILSLRRGAGPFRSFGQIAVEPRAYQLVPLLMALKQDTVRLLVADDVGIGKTIEAALIAREFIDRGEVTRTTVLCPPHLVEQWITELETRFHIRAVAVTSGSASKLERDLPPGESVFTAHPHTVVSLDYIKSDRRRDDFARTCPEFVIVDEAHTCASTGRGRHQRYELLKKLAESPTRHMVFLTATPHSGDEAAFHRLLGLIDPAFEKLPDARGSERTALRDRLGNHFVQRRRPDIDKWQEERLFPRRETKELTYKLVGEGERFFNAVLDYCVAVVESAGSDERRRRLNFWGTLALMRCVASSPAAARQALRTRARIDDDELDEKQLESQVFDGIDDALEDDDVEPAAGSDDPVLRDLIEQAESLLEKRSDDKLKLVVKHVGELLEEGFSPVVFCRFIATAHFLQDELSKKFKNVTIKAVTGELSSDQREEAIEALGQAERRLLVATDCLSEGVNLQEHFDAVVHYDLSWNPTRHEQREGRVDRFGQEREVVRTTLLYGENNPVDSAVLQVILRKAEKIGAELGVPVPVPNRSVALDQVLMQAVLLRASNRAQKTFDFMSLPAAKKLEAEWVDAAEKAKANRTIFAQRSLKPDEVLPEWRKSLGALGSTEDVKRFAGRALLRLGAGLGQVGRGYEAPLKSLPDEVKERLEAEGLVGTQRVDFTYPPARRFNHVHRTHPLVSVLAESLLERTLGLDANEAANDPSVLGRVGCWVSSGVNARTNVALVRMRHQITHGRGATATTLLVEEAGVYAWAGRDNTMVAAADALSLLASPPLGNAASAVQTRMIAQALTELDSQATALQQFADGRAQALLEDHRRVRDAASGRGSYAVKALPPVDVVGLFVLLPQVN